jgi:hypothetical protein
MKFEKSFFGGRAMKQTRFATLCVALGLALFFNHQSHAQITVDGTRESGYGARLAVQTVTSNWDNARAVASLSAIQQGNRLYVFVAGHAAPGDAIYLFIDSKSGGANKLVNNLISSGEDPWAINNFGTSSTAGFTFETGFEPDYAVRVRGGGWSSFYPLAPGSVSSYLGVSTDTNVNGGTGSPVSNLKTTWGAVSSANYAIHATGIEVEFDLNNLGVPTGTNRPIKLFAILGNEGANYFSNQALGSLSSSSDLGNSFQNTNLDTMSGVQTISLTVDNSDFDGDGTPDATDEDDDNDGLPDLVETGTGIWNSSSDTGTLPKNADTDGDGLKDGVETNTGAYVGVLDTGSNPLIADDFDRDMLPDFYDTDDDNDTLADTVETGTGIWVSSSDTGTNPKNADTDGDGLRDNVETNTGSYASASDTGTSPLVADQARVFLVGNDVLFPSGEWLVDNTNNLLAPVVGGPFSVKTVTKPIAAPGFIEFKFSAGNWNTNWGRASNTVVTLNTNNGTVSATLIQDKVPTTNDVTENLRIHRAKGEYVFTFNDATNSLEFSVARKTYATLADYAAAYGLTGADALGTADFDSDGLDNQAEFSANTAPNLTDTDGDGLTDADEISGTSATPPIPTNPLLNDTDGDGLLDLWELTNQLNPTVATGNDGASGDPDGDGINNLLEQANGTNPNSANSGFSSPYQSARLFGDFNGWSGDPTWQNAMRLTGNNTWEAMIYVTSTNLPATNGYKVITVQQGTNTAYWGRSGGVGSTLAVRGAAENLLTTNIISGTNYYHFTFNDFSGAVTVTRVNPDNDADGDLLPDAWEQYYGRFVSPALTNSPWLLISTNYNNTADLSDNGTRTNLTTGQKFQRGFNPVEDVIPPTLSLLGDEVLVVAPGQSFVDPGLDVRDNHLTFIPAVTTNTGNLDYLISESTNGVTGWQTIQYVAQDGATNRATNGVRKVIVGDWTVGYGGPIYYNLQTLGSGGAWGRNVTNNQAGAFEVYAQFYRQGATEGTNRTDPKASCWIGVTTNTNASATNDLTTSDWTWTPANLIADNNSGNDEYKATYTNLAPGTYQVVSRWKFDTNGIYGYGGLNEDNQGGALGLATEKVVGTGTNAVTNQLTYLPASITVTAVSVGYANVQWPPTGTIDTAGSFTIYAQVYSAGVTDASTNAPTYAGFKAQIGTSTGNNDPTAAPNLFIWTDVTSGGWNGANGNNDEYTLVLSGATLGAGTYYYASRFSVDGGATWSYGGIKADGTAAGIWGGENGNGVLTVTQAGSTFAGWAGGGTATNSELVGKYAIGGATSSSAASEKPVSAVDSNTLSLSAIVRTNDAKLTVVGEAGGSLTNWSTNGVSVTASPNTNGVPEGHQRQVFSVDRTNSPTRQFLRLKATLQP